MEGCTPIFRFPHVLACDPHQIQCLSFPLFSSMVPLRVRVYVLETSLSRSLDPIHTDKLHLYLYP